MMCVQPRVSAVRSGDKKRHRGEGADNKKCTLGFTGMSLEGKDFDVVIVGAGPAGMSAALWCDDLGLSCCVIESSRIFGGQLHLIHNSIKNHLGSHFIDGADCLEHFSESLKGRHFESRIGVNVQEIDVPRLVVRLSDGAALAGKAIVIASGVRRRELRVPGESEYYGKGIIDSGARFREQANGQSVAVVGGGDAALENALILAEHADRVYLVHRRNEFTAKPEFVESVRSNSKIEVLTNSVVKAFAGAGNLEFVDVRGADGQLTRLSAGIAVIRIGVEPKTDFVSPAIDADSNGYLNVDHEGRTSAKLIYAVGDVASPVSPTISSAVGTAATAVKSIAKVIHTIK